MKKTTAMMMVVVVAMLLLLDERRRIVNRSPPPPSLPFVWRLASRHQVHDLFLLAEFYRQFGIICHRADDPGL